MSDTLLSDLPKTVCDELKVILPALEVCRPHAGKFSLAELQKKGLPSPSVLVSVLGAKQDETYAGSAHSFMLQMAAYVVTKDKLNAPRDIVAANICQAILALVPGKFWGQDALGEARKVNLHTLVSGKTRDHGVSLWAVTWDQPISFYKPEKLPLGLELYVAHGDGNHEQVGG